MITGKLELYDIERDPGETRDVAESHPDVAADMDAIMKREHTPSPFWRPPDAGKK